jgi:flavin-dependent dehydrogenase
VTAGQEWHTVVVGGGPAGSTAAGLLAQAGSKVLVLERETFPRFHVGESLIPYGNDILRELGVWEKLKRGGFMPKRGAEFTVGNAAGRQRFYFARNLPAGYGQTFQVDRARFDQLLLEHAEEQGAVVRQQAKVAGLSVDADGARVSYDWNGERHETSARWLIDASGRSALAGHALGLRRSDLGMPKRLAIFAHLRGVFRDMGEEEGHIIIVRLEDSWFWFIPLDAERTSVGLVQPLDDFKAQGLSPEESFQRAVERHVELRFRLKQAEPVTRFHAEGEYTFRFHRAAGPRWLLAGDAAGFIDPIFSSGVMVALRSSALAAKAILEADSTGRALSPARQRRYTRSTTKMTNAFLHMIRMFYDRDAFEVFMARSPFLSVPRAVVSLVGGNTDLPWNLRWRIWAFYAMGRMQRYRTLVPRLSLAETPRRTVAGEAALERAKA